MKRVKKHTINLKKSALLGMGLILLSMGTQAASLKARGIDFGISAYLDFETTWMSQMPMGMSMGAGMDSISSMDETFTFDQNHLNIILNAKRGPTKVHINLESRHSFSTYDGNTGAAGRDGNGSANTVGSFRFAEAFGEHKFNQFLSLKAGYFYTPFGIYNEVRYATPLFATVVLPFIYEMPGNYSGTIIVPSNSNLMLSGYYGSDLFDVSYNVYASGSERNENYADATDLTIENTNAGFGPEKSKQKGLGGRVQFSFADGKYSFGTSYYSVKPANDLVRTRVSGADIDLLLPYGLHFQAEYAQVENNDGLKNAFIKHGYFARLMYEVGKVTPFIMYDAFKDPNDLVYRSKMNRVGTGLGYEVSENFYLKAEYHYHWFSDDVQASKKGMGMMPATITKGPDTQHMIRTSTIFYF